VQTGPWTIRSTTFSAAQTGAAAAWVSNGWYHAGLGWSRVYVYAGSTTALSYHVTDGRGAPAINKTVTFVMGKTHSASNARVHVGSTYSTGNQATVTGTTDSNGNVTFALVSDNPSTTNTIYTQTAAYVDSPTVDTMDMLDIHFYNAPATPTPYPTGIAPANSITSATIRLISPTIDRSNSMDGTSTAASWVASHWYAPGLRYFTHEEFVGSTINLTYHASNQDGLAIINHPIYLSVNKICSGSNASFTSPSLATPIGPAVNCLSAGGTLSGMTDGSGNVTFTLTNTNTDSQTGHFTDMFINYNEDAHLYSQVMPFIFGPATYTQNPTTQAWTRNAGQYDIEDITNFIWSKHLPPSPSIPTCAAGYLWCAEFNDPAGPLSASTTSGPQWLPNIGSGCPLLCGVAGNSHIVHTDDANQLDGNGNLLITATKQSNSTWACESDATKTCYGEWTSGRIWTRNRVGFTYGKLEARIKAPLGSGTHPAFWMVGADIPNNPWPGSGEIDIMETNGDMPYTNWMTAHEPPVPCAPYCEGWQHEQKPDNNTMTHTEPLSSAFHTYGILWEPDRIQWTFDGVVKAEVRKGDYSCVQCWSFNKEYYIYLNLSMFDGFTGPTDPTMTSTTFTVDWVRYSKYNGHGTLTMH
jgi:beta-glucanase (GH16 family)